MTTITAAPPIFFMQAHIDLKHLHTWMGERRIEDLGHAMHCLTTETLGEAAPKQFRIMASRRSPHGVLYGYTLQDVQQLVRNHRSFAVPSQQSAMPAERIAAKQMPTEWPQNTDIAFDVRCRPLRQRERQEIDAFWSMREANPDENISRHDAYIRWIAEYFERRGGADLKSATLEAYQQSKTVTSAHRSTPNLPEATIRGVLTITDSNDFSKVLAAGIGRHRTFGYGMLLIRPAIRNHGVPR